MGGDIHGNFVTLRDMLDERQAIRKRVPAVKPRSLTIIATFCRYSLI